MRDLRRDVVRLWQAVGQQRRPGATGAGVPLERYRALEVYIASGDPPAECPPELEDLADLWDYLPVFRDLARGKLGPLQPPERDSGEGLP